MFDLKSIETKKSNFSKLRFKEFHNSLQNTTLKNISSYRSGNGLVRESIIKNGKLKCIFYNDLFSKYSALNPNVETATNVCGKIVSLGNELLFPSLYNIKSFFKPISLKEKNIILGNFISVFKIIDTINSDYICLYFLKLSNLKRVYKLIEGSIGQQLHAKYLFQFPITISVNLNEQNKIAKMFLIIFKQIEIQEKIIKKSRFFLNILINKIFKKLMQKSKNLIAISFVATETNVRNKDNKVSLVLSVNKTLGLVSQSTSFKNRLVASVDKSNYKIIAKNDFAYNPARINIGSISFLKDYELGIVSPVYFSFKINREIVIAQFLNYFFKTEIFNKQVEKRLEGSVRNSLKYKDFKTIKIPLEKLSYQEELVILFESINKKITKEMQINNFLENVKNFLLNGFFE